MALLFTRRREAHMNTASGTLAASYKYTCLNSKDYLIHIKHLNRMILETADFSCESLLLFADNMDYFLPRTQYISN